MALFLLFPALFQLHDTLMREQRHGRRKYRKQQYPVIYAEKYQRRQGHITGAGDKFRDGIQKTVDLVLGIIGCQQESLVKLRIVVVGQINLHGPVIYLFMEKGAHPLLCLFLPALFKICPVQIGTDAVHNINGHHIYRPHPVFPRNDDLRHGFQ